MALHDAQAKAHEEIAVLTGLLKEAGITLESEQPHVTGERYLLGGANKLVLFGSQDGRRIVVKASKEESGIAEIHAEKKIRDALRSLPFATDSLKVPRELYHGKHGAYVVSCSEFIDQKEVLSARPLSERFFMSLRAFEVQEAFHASTYEHLRTIKGVFPVFSAETYIAECAGWMKEGSEASASLDEAHAYLVAHTNDVERYSGFLTHSDFVPHNMRLDGRTLWFLDCVALRFGNKHESWARFVNYMLIHDPELAEKLLEYHAQEHPAEAGSLHAMRVYKAAYLVAFYARVLPKTDGDLQTLTRERLALWADITLALTQERLLDPARVAAYVERRNALRAPEERERQKGFNTVD